MCDDLQAVLEFIYLGETRLEKDRVASFLETAKELQIEGLVNEGDDGSTNKDTINKEYNQNESLPAEIITNDLGKVYTNKEVTERDQDCSALSCKMCDFVSKAKRKQNRQVIMSRHMGKAHNMTLEHEGPGPGRPKKNLPAPKNTKVTSPVSAARKRTTSEEWAELWDSDEGECDR